DLVGGHLADGIATERDLFYLPVRVPKALAAVPAFDDEGSALSEPLLGPPQRILAGDNVEPRFRSWATILGIGLFAIYGALAMLVVRGKMAVRRYAYASLPLLLAFGLLGCIIVFLRFVSQHTFTWYNLHLYFLWPID